ncbi:MAG: lysophospholipid acyltransferase family protein [Gammaproteobacteria bacterium]
MTEPGPGGGLRNSIYRKVSRSGRRMTAGRQFLYSLVVPLGLGLVRLWWKSCRVVRVEGQHHLDAALAKAPSLVPCYWHQHQLFCGKYLVDQSSGVNSVRAGQPAGADPAGSASRPPLKVGWLISPSVDGELGAMMVRRLGGHVIRGSSTSTGARALRDYYEALVKDAVSPVITPDGPRGPRFEFKPGAILLAQMSGRPILPLAYAASRAWLIKWDKFVLPVPFSRIVIAVGAPRYVPRVTDAAAIARLQGELKSELKSLFGVARASLDGRAP